MTGLEQQNGRIAGGPFDFAVIGAGIIGLATAHALQRRYPGASLLLLEKEDGVARHQSGRNSGVIHSGIYYPPGSLKAELARRGKRSIVEFCRTHGIAYEVCGKLIVATSRAELPRLEHLHRRGLDNGLEVVRIGRDEARSLEPHVECIAALHVPSTGIADYRGVCAALADLVREAGAEIALGTEVGEIASSPRGHRLSTQWGATEARVLVNCAGLHSDRVARRAGLRPRARIVPFRGEYYELRPERTQLVRNLIYPVPNPDFPFLGVHLTRGVDGGVHAGPNAVLALKREGYRRRDLDLRDLVDIVGYRGFRSLARRHAREGMHELYRSLRREAFVRSLQRLVPEVRREDVVRAPAGVRAQALAPDGSLVDDFLIVETDSAVHVCNAPSPGATSSLEIGESIAGRVPVPAARRAARSGRARAS